MKKSDASIVSIVAEYTDFSVYSTLLLKGSPMSQANFDLFRRCLRYWAFLTEDVMLSLCEEKARRVRLRNFLSAISTGDLLTTLSFFDNLFFFLIGEDATVETFKQFRQSQVIEDGLIGRLLSPINILIFRFLKSDDKRERANLLRPISYFLRFGKKLNFESIGLEEEALRQYVEIEENLGEITRGLESEEELLENLSSIIEDWFHGFSITSLLPCNGPGSVAEGPLTLHEKFHSLKIDRRIKLVLNGGFPDRYKEYYPFEPDSNLVRCSRTIFVPKTASKLRTISMEPAGLQYLQQGVMHALYDYIEGHPYMGVRMKFRDQTQNQVLALEGSMTGSFSTIDLSAASDYVSWYLVRRLFKRVPMLYKWLLITRSEATLLPDGSTRVLRKFAPMGSALCFPIESIIFAACVEQASRIMKKRRIGDFSLYSVFGDDLVVSTHIFSLVCNILKRCGFKVNDVKSFSRGPFRESCGEDYYAATRVTAVYYRVPRYTRRISPSAYSSLCSLANLAKEHGLAALRRIVIDDILSACRGVGPYFCSKSTCSPYLYSSQPTNFHSKSRWNVNYQRQEGRFLTVKTRKRDGELNDDRLSYFVKLIELSRRSSKPARSLDESSSRVPLFGCVEFFSSTVLPITPYLVDIEGYA